VGEGVDGLFADEFDGALDAVEADFEGFGVVGVGAEEEVAAVAEEAFGEVAGGGAGAVHEAPGVALEEEAAAFEGGEEGGVVLEGGDAFGVGHDEGEAEGLEVVDGGGEGFGEGVGPEVEEEVFAEEAVGGDLVAGEGFQLGPVPFEVEFSAGEEGDGDVGVLVGVVEDAGAVADGGDGVAGELGPDVGGAGEVGVSGGGEEAGAGEGVVEGGAAVVDGGEEVGVDVDAAGHKGNHSGRSFSGKGGRELATDAHGGTRMGEIVGFSFAHWGRSGRSRGRDWRCGVAKVERVARTWRQWGWRVMVRVGRVVLLAYVVVLILFSVMQTRLVFPGMATQGTAESVVSPPAGSELVRLMTAEGVPLVGLFFKARLGSGVVDPEGGKRATMIYFYGNAMCLKDAVEDCEGFSRLGANVLGVEYPGFGMAGGEASEGNCYAAAEAGYRYVLGRGDVDGGKIVPCGWSLGAAVAIDLAARHAGEGHVCGVITFSAFTSMVEVGRYHYPFLPVSGMLRHRFDSVGKMGRVTVPVLIGHGEKDEIVPFEMAGRLAAAAAAGGPVKRLNVAGAGHNDFFEVGGEQVNAAVRLFLSNVTAAR
jgi:uncharacterized protein